MLTQYGRVRHHFLITLTNQIWYIIADLRCKQAGQEGVVEEIDNHADKSQYSYHSPHHRPREASLRPILVLLLAARVVVLSVAAGMAAALVLPPGSV